VWGYLNYFCAAIIEAILRGRLGRRRAQTCAQLHYIRKAHPISLNKALSPGGEIKVFWYKSKEQVRLLFENYLVLAERTGFLPPRYVVESNVREIVRFKASLESSKRHVDSCTTVGTSNQSPRIRPHYVGSVKMAWHHCPEADRYIQVRGYSNQGNKSCSLLQAYEAMAWMDHQEGIGADASWLIKRRNTPEGVHYQSLQPA